MIALTCSTERSGIDGVLRPAMAALRSNTWRVLTALFG